MTAIMLERFPLYRLRIEGVQNSALRNACRAPPTFEYRGRLTLLLCNAEAGGSIPSRMLSWFHQVSVPPLRARALVMLLAVVVVGPRAASADRAMARALVEEGQRLVAASQNDAGLGRFERAMSEDPDYLPAYDAAIPW